METKSCSFWLNFAGQKAIGARYRCQRRPYQRGMEQIELAFEHELLAWRGRCTGIKTGIPRGSFFSRGPLVPALEFQRLATQKAPAENQEKGKKCIDQPIAVEAVSGAGSSSRLSSTPIAAQHPTFSRWLSVCGSKDLPRCRPISAEGQRLNLKLQRSPEAI